MRRSLWFRLSVGLLGALSGLSTSTAAQERQQDFTIRGTDIQVSVAIQMNAGELFDKCSFDAANPGPEAFICAGYLSGAEDGMTIIWGAYGMDRAFCPPPGTQRAVLLRRFMDYLRAHPEKRELPAALVALQAYREAYPCAAGRTP